MLLDIVFALLIALLVVVLFAGLLRRPGPWDGTIWFFLVVFLGAWAVAAWATPVGPAWFGVYWLPILVAALLIGLLVAATGPARVRRRRPATVDEAERAETAAVVAVSAVFWLLVLALLVVAVFGYLD